MTEHSEKRDWTPWIGMAIVILLMVAALSFQGRIWWCKWDSPIYVWNSGVWSKHNSQHFFDPYLFTHLLHGVALYWILRLIFKERLSLWWLLFLAVSAESVWELVENSRWILERYRETTASLDYFGDSIANSFGDIIACGMGFLAAHKLKAWLSLLFFVVVEVVLILTMRDSLMMNILMLIYPLESIKQWQVEIAFVVFYL